MTAKGRPKTMTEVLRQEISRSGMSLLGLSKATGLARQSLTLFARGKQSLRLDMADRLAAFFGVEVRAPGRRGKAKGKSGGEG